MNDLIDTGDPNYVGVNVRGPMELYMTDGNGALINLTWDVRGGRLMLSRRNKAFALAMLDLARENVEQSEEPS